MARVACVQLAARDLSDARRSLDDAVAMAGEAAAGADLVVLPEAVYPGYILGERSAVDLLPRGWYDDAVARFAAVAAATGAHVCVGLVRPVGRALRNSAVLLSPGGGISTSDKSFLWHFDRSWFEPGDPSSVVVTPVGAVGVIVCADARMMELPRRLAIAGARILLDPTGLVLGPSGTNAQIEYMLAARAIENSVFLAVANRCGTEAGVARYAGRSAILAPDGARLTEAPGDEPAIVVAEIDVSTALGPAGRDPAGYAEIGEPTVRLGIARVLEGPPPRRGLRVAIAGRAGGERTSRPLGADVVVGPGATLAGMRAQHGELLEGPPGVLVCVLVGERGLIPEEARTAMLRGASALVWFTGDAPPPIELVRTRADENRVCVLVVDAAGRWTAVAPTGAIVGAGPAPGVDMSFVDLPVQLAWSKEMVPGTDVVAGRRPELWPEIAAPDAGAVRRAQTPE